MSDYIRRAHLVSPSGVGAITVLKGGTSVICAGIDHWFSRLDRQDPNESVDLREFEVDEPRLRRLLSVDHFYMPPDYRIPSKGSDNNKNVSLRIQFLRFPRWSVCNSCHEMREIGSGVRGTQYCDRCKKERGRGRRIHQVRFAAVCEGGHLQDFPWREWAHKTAAPACTKKLSLSGGVGASLAAISVSCECGRRRNLSDIMTADASGETELTRSLDEAGTLFTCSGKRPWLGDHASETCSRHLRGTLINASNLYFASVESSIFLPPVAGPSVPIALLDFLAAPMQASIIATLKSFDGLSPQSLRKRWGKELSAFSDADVEAAIAGAAPGGESVKAQEPEDPVDFRHQEYVVLQSHQSREQLEVKVVDGSEYTGLIKGQPFSHFFSTVSLVERLRETRALYGFTRVKPENKSSREQRKTQLRLKPPPPSLDWLPAYAVYGEGIFLTLNEASLANWEAKALPSRSRSDLLGAAYKDLSDRGWGAQTQLSDRFLLVHTLAHLLINRLTFDCGYSSASLKERLYVSSEKARPMAGLLIYTAAGDVDGTMGGLVRMGRPGSLEAVVRRALESADWCSADPVCMEMGQAGGQGPDSCNLAACHACALVPETACEQFNRFLDRGVVVGVPSQNSPGFFR